MTEEEKQRGLELQGYINSVRDMTLKEIAIKHLKKYHLPKFLAGLLVKFSYPLLLAKDYRLSELEETINKLREQLALRYDLEDKIKELEKENAELKGIKDVATLIRANNDTVTTLMQLNNMLVSRNQQLTKAKEIIKNLLSAYTTYADSFDDRDNEIVEEAEQFLKEV